MKNIKCSALILVLMCVVISLQAQDPRLKKANQTFDEFAFPEAAEQYKKILSKHDDGIPEAKIKLAECYRLMNMPVESEYWYEQVVELAESEPIHKYYYAMALKANGKFERAKNEFLEYAQVVPADTRGLRQVEACEQSTYFLTDPGIYEASLVTNINTERADFGPAFFKEGIVYASESNVKYSEEQYNWTEAPFLDLFYSTQEGDSPSAMSKPENFKGKVNTWLHEGTVTFTQEFETMYFTRNNYHKGKVGYDTEEKIKTVNLQIYESKASGEKWGDGKPLSFNSDDFSCGHPALSYDGQALYFVSDMPGGYGGTDIYVSYKSGDNWGQPENLGPEINTEGEEMFPFISKDETLYFASDALPGLGGLDIFSTKLEDGIWSEPENLRYPINTNGDDFAYIIDEENEKGYFSSNRPGGKGNDDIYSFTKLKNIMTGIVVDCDTQEPIEDAFIELMESGMVMQKRNSNANGGFTFPISPGKEYKVVASKTGYIDDFQEVSTIGLEGSEVEVKIPLCPDVEETMCIVEGRVFDGTTNEPVSGAIVSLTNTETRDEKTDVTGEDGMFSFELESESDFVLMATKEFFIAKNITISTVGRDCADTLTRDMAMDIPMTKVGGDQLSDEDKNNINTGKDVTFTNPIIISDGHLNSGGVDNSHILDLEHIYYDFDKWFIRDDAKIELNKVVTFMNDNPGLIVELHSHTDARGTSEYNQGLSEKRATSALNYIVSRGISNSRISAKGYGESDPVNECVDGTHCNDAKHQENRRTEFWLTGYQGGQSRRSLGRYYYMDDPHRGKNYYKTNAPTGSFDSGVRSYAPGINNSPSLGTLSPPSSTSGSSYSGTTSTYTSSSSTPSGGINTGTISYDDTPTTNTPTYYDTISKSGNETTVTSTIASPASDPNFATGTITSGTFGPSKGVGIEYKIQLGAFREPDMTEFEPLVDLGLLNAESTVQGVKRVILGTFYDESTAANALLLAKQRGFGDAFVVKYQDGLRVGR